MVAEINVSGVQLIKDGEGFTQNDCKAFMGPCKSRCKTCRTGSKGELRTVDGEFLTTMLAGMMFGDYPEEAAE